MCNLKLKQRQAIASAKQDKRSDAGLSVVSGARQSKSKTAMAEWRQAGTT